MNANRGFVTAKLLSMGGLVWCITIGLFIWFTPIRSSGVSTITWSSSGSSGGTSAVQQTVPIETTRRFADISLFGPVPLLIPVLLAGLATWGVWRRRRIAALIATALLLVFCFLAGFSIGPGYVVGAGAIVWSVLLVWVS
jgi:hypothetical protein